MAVDTERRASIVDTILANRAEKADQEAELKRRLEEAKPHAQELSKSLRQLFEEYFPPLSDDISQEELDAMDKDERFKVLFQPGWQMKGNHTKMATLTGEIMRLGEDPVTFEIESEYPRRHRRPNSPSFTIDVDGLDDHFMIWSDGGKLESKTRHGNEPATVIVGGRGYPTYPDREGPAFAEDILWYQEFLDDISQAGIELTPSSFNRESYRH